MIMIKLIIFNFDGVIADTLDLHTLVTKHFFPNSTKQDQIEHTMGNPLLKPKIPFERSMFAEYFSLYTDGMEAKLLFPIKDELIALTKKYTLVISSSANQEAISKLFRLTGLTKAFSGIYDLNTAFDKIQKFHMIEKDYEVKPEECLFITDTVGDVLQAQKADIKTIAVTWGFHNKELLQSAKPFAIIDNIRELEKFI